VVQLYATRHLNTDNDREQEAASGHFEDVPRVQLVSFVLTEAIAPGMCACTNVGVLLW
jgi:hypothetical protein